MIFKQRLFTILLGLLFATVLTDQASALYDPGVGRFCSRDPIGYEDDRNGGSLYAIGIRLDKVDSSGMTIEITPLIPDSERRETGVCGEPIEAQYKYRFTKASPCKGFLIQEITICCGSKKCDKNGCCQSLNIDPPVGNQGKDPSEWPSDVKCETYWEMWHVSKGAFSPDSPFNYSDMFKFSYNKKTCGYMSQLAEARLYCDGNSNLNDGSHRQTGIPEPPWTAPGLRRIPNCGAFTSGALKGTGREPVWWNKEPAKAWESGRRGASVEWKCCNDNRVTVQHWST